MQWELPRPRASQCATGAQERLQAEYKQRCAMHGESRKQGLCSVPSFVCGVCPGRPQSLKAPEPDGRRRRPIPPHDLTQGAELVSLRRPYASQAKVFLRVLSIIMEMPPLPRKTRHRGTGAACTNCKLQIGLVMGAQQAHATTHITLPQLTLIDHVPQSLPLRRHLGLRAAHGAPLAAAECGPR